MSVAAILEYLKQHHDLANAIAALAAAGVALLALVVSVVSMYFTWRSLKHQQTHNRLSVRPLPYITVGDYENSVYVKIRNNGTGPLIVRCLTVSGASNPSAPLVENMPALLPGVVWTNFVGATEGRSIAVGGEMVLLDLSAERPNSDFQRSRDGVRKALGVLSLSLQYTDIYGSSLPLCSRDLTWFHRTLALSCDA